MNKKDNRVSYFPFKLTPALLLGLLLFLAPGFAGAQTTSMLQAVNLDPLTTTCQGLRLAARGPERVVVGWATANPARGICYRQRLNYLWEPVKQLGPASGAQPRDLSMAFDAAGRLHMVWTALEGRTRRLFYARQDQPGATPQAAPLPIGPASGDADFPALSPDAHGAMVVVWQESREMRFSIRACRIQLTGQLEDLGSVSGVSLSGLSPQVLSTEPTIQVAWYEINESGSELRVDEWLAAERRWRPALAEREASLFPKNAQVLLTRTEQGMLGCWQDVLEGGRGAIKLELKLAPTAERPAASIMRDFADPLGKHTRPTLSGSLSDRLTLVWQVVTQGAQAIRIASIKDPNAQPTEFTISQPEQRYAAMPDHLTMMNHTWVVWTDDVREGGKGGVYFVQIVWPNFF